MIRHECMFQLKSQTSPKMPDSWSAITPSLIHVPGLGSDTSKWTRLFKFIPSSTTTMLPATHTEMVTFILNKMCSQGLEDDR